MKREMNKGFIHNVNKVVELENATRAERQNAPEEQPAVAALVLQGTVTSFSDECERLLRVLGAKRDLK